MNPANAFKCIDQTDGIVMVANSKFIVTTANQPLLLLTASAGGSGLQLLTAIGNTFVMAANDVSAIEVDGSSNTGWLQAIGNVINRNTNTAYSNDHIELSGNVRGAILGNMGNDIGTGSGNFISVDTDDHMSIVGNLGVGYAIDIPGAISDLVHSSNNPTAA